ncbi:MAG: UDP-N-acetylmuramoyl-L-alanine--D-glutamate ligase [Verrucomicrobiales bacterium]|nr:UDP-N-acetylmuramoyl-L-alanine--D-glutamate ligase [Verrucomicrobiales bacterium]
MLGCGQSGMAAARLALREGANVCVFDTGNSSELQDRAEELGSEGCEIAMGDDAVCADPKKYEFAVISPGISLDWMIATQFTDSGVRVIGEMEFSYPFCSSGIIGVTGTNGKTTTVELIEKILNGCGEAAVAGGNYGRPLADIVCGSTSYSSVILEISSFQLEAISEFHPNVAVWTNFASDHLDRYSGIDEYKSAKMKLFVNQNERDWAVINGKDELQGLKAQTITFSAYQESGSYSFNQGNIVCGDDVLFNLQQTKLRGAHNAENLMAATAVAQIKGYSIDSIIDSLSDYTAPQHRCELVATIDGVDYINDSKATNLHAMESALKSLVDSEDGIVLIAGGKDKGLSFADVADSVSRYVKYAILIGETRFQVAENWAGKVDCRLSEDIDEAVSLGRSLAKGASTILFSPGTSSFDMFSGYEERGDLFKAAVEKQIKQK